MTVRPFERVTDEHSEALDLFMASVRNLPVLKHDEVLTRFRDLTAADAEFREALCEIPGTAERLVEMWRERRKGGLVSGLLLEWDAGSAKARSREADRVFSALAELVALKEAGEQTAGVETQILELLYATPVERSFLVTIHDEHRAAAGARKAGEGGSGALERATVARATWERERADLVQYNLKLVISVAKRYRRRDLSLLELVQEGALGLVRAIEKFDAERGYRFSTYAVWWIEQAVIRGVQKFGRTVRLPTHVHEQQIHLNRADAQLRARGAGDPGIAELAAQAGIAFEDADRVAATLAPIRSIDAFVGDDQGLTLADVLPDDAAPVDEVTSMQEVREILDRCLEGLTHREQHVLRRRFGLTGEAPESLETIGRRLDLSRERIRQIERGVLEKLRGREDVQALSAVL